MTPKKREITEDNDSRIDYESWNSLNLHKVPPYDGKWYLILMRDGSKLIPIVARDVEGRGLCDYSGEAVESVDPDLKMVGWRHIDGLIQEVEE